MRCNLLERGSFQVRQCGSLAEESMLHVNPVVDVHVNDGIDMTLLYSIVYYLAYPMLVSNFMKRYRHDMKQILQLLEL